MNKLKDADRSHFILEALKNQLALLVLVLTDTVFSFQLVVFHRLRVIQIHILRVEHVGAQIQHSSLVDLGSFVLRSVDLRVVLYKLTDLLHKTAILLLHFEVLLLGEI